MRITVLGKTTLTADDNTPIPIPQPKVRQLLTVLAIADRPLPSADLQEALWEQPTAGSMRSALTTTVTKLRRLLPRDVLIHDEDGYQLVLAPDDHLDAAQFTRLVHQASAMRDINAATAAGLYSRALTLWGGRRLPDLPDTGPAWLWAYPLLLDRRDAVEGLAAAQLALGQHTAVARDLHWHVAHDATNEHLWALLMLALYRDGRKAEALRIFRRARRTLIGETGAEPGMILTHLRARVIADDPTLTWLPNLAARETRAIAAGIDPTIPASARMYDYLLGGHDNFAADREAAERLKSSAPYVTELAHANRAFTVRAVEYLAQQGIAQFLDLGAGIPTSPNVHEVAWHYNPAARVAYVDNDPFVNAYNPWRAAPGVTCVDADIRDPDQLLAHPGLRSALDAAEPVALLAVSVLHFCADAQQIVDAFKGWLPSGSYLVVACSSDVGISAEDRELVQASYEGATAQHHFLTRSQIEALFDGLELVEPGVVETALWLNPDGARFPIKPLAGVARKP